MLKLASKKAHIDDQMDRRLHIYHGPPGERGDPLEVSLAYGMSIYANWLLPTYCMFTVRERDIIDNTVMISKRMNNEFRCSAGWISIVRHDNFERPLNRNSTLEVTSPHGPVRSSML